MKIALVAAPFGYGPTAKAIALAQHLADSGCEVSLFGPPDGVRLAREAGIKADTYEPMADLDQVGRDAALVSVMDMTIVRTASKRGRPLMVVDSLWWARGHWEQPFDVSRNVSVIAQRFFESRGPFSSTAPAVDYVGPILPKDLPPGDIHSSIDQIVVSLGGLDSPANIPGAPEHYLRWLAAMLTAAQIPVPIRLLVPRRYFDDASAWFNGVATVNQTGWDRIFETADGHTLVLMVPGLETVLELGAMQVPFLFLPPFNGTQLAQGRLYREKSPRSTVFEDVFDRYPRAGSVVGFREWTGRVQTINRSLLDESQASRWGADALRKVVTHLMNHPDEARRSIEWWTRQIAGLGTNGSSDAARAIVATVQTEFNHARLR